MPNTPDLHNRRPQRPGFTVVELLVVIAIIALLAALLLPAIGVARARAWRFGVTTELANIQRGFNSFKEDWDGYPPDFSDVISEGSPNNNSAVEIAFWQSSKAYRFIRDTWNKIDAAELNLIRQLAIDQHLNNATCLVFWLNGISEDPKFPFTGNGGPLSAEKLNNRLFDFDRNRLSAVNADLGGLGIVTMYEYHPNRVNVSMVYFDSRTYIYPDSRQTTGFGFAGWGGLRPYKNGKPPGNANTGASSVQPGMAIHFMNRDTFQVVCTGRDRRLGTDVVGSDDVPYWPVVYSKTPFHPTDYPNYGNSTGVPPAMAGYFEPHKDNMANFSEGGQVGDME